MDQLLQHLANAVIVGGTYALLGIGLTLIFGIMRIVNFTHGELYMQYIVDSLRRQYVCYGIPNGNATTVRNHHREARASASRGLNRDFLVDDDLTNT